MRRRPPAKRFPEIQHRIEDKREKRTKLIATSLAGEVRKRELYACSRRWDARRIAIRDGAIAARAVR